VSRRAIAIALLALAATGVAAAGAATRQKWDTRVLALVPPPGFPALAYVHPNGRIYEGTYANPAGDSVPSRVLEYSRHGTLLRSWTVRGQDLSDEHGVQVAATDARGRLILLDHSPPRALVLNPNNGRQHTYAKFRDLPACVPPEVKPGCSPTTRDQAPVPDYAAWGHDGALYVTDYQQALIWRVPPGGGKPKVWLASRLFDGDMFGTTGIVLADRRRFLVSQQSSGGGGDGDPTTGKLYSVKIRRHHRPGRIRQLWESGPVDGPDGFAIARSGNVYIALAGSNQLAEVSPGGQEIDRFPSDPSGDNGSSVPFDTPSSAMFLGKRLIVANQSFITGTPANQAILNVYVGERGKSIFVPKRAGLNR
jgi:sugar lactone lactonase YvrE